MSFVKRDSKSLISYVCRELQCEIVFEVFLKK